MSGGQKNVGFRHARIIRKTETFRHGRNKEERAERRMKNADGYIPPALRIYFRSRLQFQQPLLHYLPEVTPRMCRKENRYRGISAHAARALLRKAFA